MPGPGEARIVPPGALAPLAVALPALLASLLWPWPGQWACAVGLIVVLGVPHGALDVEIGRTLLRDRVGPAWFPLFAAPYLALVAAVLLAWQVMPLATLAGFLALSVWHFGTEETGGGGLPALVRGGLPIALPVLFHGAGTAQVLDAVTGTSSGTVPVWLVWASLAWIPLAALWAVGAARRGDGGALALVLVLALGFAVLPPLTAFALYFVVVHAPAHTAALIAHPTRAPRVRDAGSAWRLALPITVLTILIGAALWPVSPGAPAARLVCVTLRLLAALTLPHMLLDAWLDRREQRAAPTLAANPA
jgi:beta-carotene 15,15'-dioxygenase